MTSTFDPPLPDDSTPGGGTAQKIDTIWLIVAAILFYVIVIRGGKI